MRSIGSSGRALALYSNENGQCGRQILTRFPALVRFPAATVSCSRKPPDSNEQPATGWVLPVAGLPGSQPDHYSFTNSILVGVSCILPSTSFTVPVAFTFLDSWQILSWNFLLTSFCTR